MPPPVVLGPEFGLPRSRSIITEQPLHSIQYMQGGMNGSDGPHFGPVSAYHHPFHPFHPMSDSSQVDSRGYDDGPLALTHSAHSPPRLSLDPDHTNYSSHHHGAYDDTGKLLARKEKNRQAAARSRKRKQDHMDVLEEAIKRQTEEIRVLKEELSATIEKLKVATAHNLADTMKSLDKATDKCHKNGAEA